MIRQRSMSRTKVGTTRKRMIALVAASAIATAGVVGATGGAANAATGTVITTNGDVLHVWSAPTQPHVLIGTLAPGTTISFSCYVQGDAVTGPYGTETTWDKLDSPYAGGYVTDAWIYTGSNSAVVPLCALSAPTNQYSIAWTGGGIYPRAGASLNASNQAGILTDGQLVTVACEANAQQVTDTVGYRSTLWDKLSTGGWVPNVYINTGTNGRTPGVPACTESTDEPTNAGCVGPADSGSYSGAAGCYWAVANWNAAAQYQDDCTWFVSQALWSGGMPQSSDWTSASTNVFILSVQNPGSSKGPFLYPGPTVDATEADDLVNYLVGNGLATRATIYWGDNTAHGAQIGDIIAYHWNRVGSGADASLSTIDHLALVTGFSATYPLVSQHSFGQHNRGWSWDATTNNWIQYSFDSDITPIAYLIHLTH